MIDLSQFHSTYGVPQDCIEADSGVLQVYEARLPESFLSLWKTHGFCKYLDGLLWLVQPSSFDDIVTDWLPNAAVDTCIVARTGFGDLFVWAMDGFHFLDVHYSRTYRIANSGHELLNEFLCERSIANRILRQEMYEQCKGRLGEPARDECFAFLPALALGGSETPEAVEIVKLREHLNMLSQLAT